MWEANLHVDEMPPEPPEPTLGINFARNAMQERNGCHLLLTMTHGCFQLHSTLVPVFALPEDHTWTEKCTAVLIYLASSNTARDEIMKALDLVNGLATVLDVGEHVEQEQAAACLLYCVLLMKNAVKLFFKKGDAIIGVNFNKWDRKRKTESSKAFDVVPRTTAVGCITTSNSTEGRELSE